MMMHNSLARQESSPKLIQRQVCEGWMGALGFCCENSKWRMLNCWCGVWLLLLLIAINVTCQRNAVIMKYYHGPAPTASWSQRALGRLSTSPHAHEQGQETPCGFNRRKSQQQAIHVLSGAARCCFPVYNNQHKLLIIWKGVEELSFLKGRAFWGLSNHWC